LLQDKKPLLSLCLTHHTRDSSATGLISALLAPRCGYTHIYSGDVWRGTIGVIEMDGGQGEEEGQKLWRGADEEGM